MDSLLKTEKTQVDALGRVVALRELSAKAFADVVAAQRAEKGLEAAAIACKYGVIEWEKESVEDIMGSVTPFILNELASKIFELSGVDAKNSEGDQSEDSSSDLH